MVFAKGTITRGFKGKKHSDYSKRMMSESRKEGYKRKAQICLNCGKPMKPVYDEIAKKITGYIWECECSPGVRMMIA